MHRLVFQRYLRISRGLLGAGIDLSRDCGATRFALAMRDALTAGHEQLAEGSREMDRLLQSRQSRAAEIDSEILDRELDAWCRSRLISASSAADAE